MDERESTLHLAHAPPIVSLPAVQLGSSVGTGVLSFYPHSYCSPGQRSFTKAAIVQPEQKAHTLSPRPLRRGLVAAGGLGLGFVSRSVRCLFILPLLGLMETGQTAPGDAEFWWRPRVVRTCAPRKQSGTWERASFLPSFRRGRTEPTTLPSLSRKPF